MSAFSLLLALHDCGCKWPSQAPWKSAYQIPCNKIMISLVYSYQSYLLYPPILSNMPFKRGESWVPESKGKIPNSNNAWARPEWLFFLPPHTRALRQGHFTGPVLSVNLPTKAKIYLTQHKHVHSDTLQGPCSVLVYHPSQTFNTQNTNLNNDA